jgi:hypothetical protein
MTEDEHTPTDGNDTPAPERTGGEDQDLSPSEIAVSMYAGDIFFESEDATVDVEGIGTIVSVDIQAGKPDRETKVQMAMTVEEVEELISELEAAAASVSESA